MRSFDGFKVFIDDELIGSWGLYNHTLIHRGYAIPVSLGSIKDVFYLLFAFYSMDGEETSSFCARIRFEPFVELNVDEIQF